MKKPQHDCNIWCRIHVDANYGNHEHYPREVYVRSTDPNRRWDTIKVHIGPGAFYPYRPTAPQWEAMRRVCPHEQMRLDCNNCLRHTFRPREI